jgi:hypothetical protein
MGQLFAPKLPSPPPPPADSGPSPTQADPAVQRARDDARRRTAAGGRQSTVLTSPAGLLTPASTTRKTLLGS